MLTYGASWPQRVNQVDEDGLKGGDENNSLGEYKNEETKQFVIQIILWKRMYRNSVITLALKKYATLNIVELDFLDFPRILRKNDGSQDS